MKNRNLDRVAAHLLRHALEHAPEAAVLGDVAAAEIAALAFYVLRGSACPRCGAVLGCDIDCPLCMLAVRWESCLVSTDALQ